jgi:SNF2 family DNA or RNA helicase
MKKSFKIEIVNIQDKNKFVFRSNYCWKNCLDASNEKTSRCYSLPFNYINYIKLKKIISFKSFKVDLTRLISDNLNFEKKELRHYQKSDVEFLSKLKSVAIFNEMRTGKTPISLALTSKWKISKILVIVPGILQKQWQESIEEWLREPAYIISQLSKDDRMIFYEKFCTEKNIILIVSKDTFKIDSLYFKKLRKEYKREIGNFCVLIDESHYLRNYDSKQSKSIYSLNDSNYKVLLTGTPIVNNYADIFGILKFMNSSKYSSYWSFVKTFFIIDQTEFISNSGKKVFLRNISGFKSKLLERQLKSEISTFSVSRKQKDVLPWLPSIIRQKEVLIMDKKQQDIYDKFLNSSSRYSAELISNLKSIVLYPRHLVEEFNGNGVKIDYLIEFCRENENKQILIFSTRTETFLDHLSNSMKKEKIEFGMITGKINRNQREIYIKKFQNSEIKVMLCNVMSAGFGLNLDNADTMIFADRSYSPADNDQAESRFLPTTEFQNLKIRLIIDLICKDTIEEKILRLLKRKKNIMEIINVSPNLIFEN